MFVAACLSGSQTWLPVFSRFPSLLYRVRCEGTPGCAAGARNCKRDTKLTSIPHLEREFHPKLRGEGYAHRGARAEEVAQRSGWHAQLIQARNRLRLRASGVQAKRGGIGKIVHGRGQRGNVGHEKRTGIVAIEQVEEFGEGRKRPALANLDRAADTEVRLDVRRAAKFVERGLQPVDHRAVPNWRGHGKGPRAFRLTQQGNQEAS